MTTFQKVMKCLAMAFAILLAVGIVGGVLSMFGLFGSDAVTKEIKVYSVPSEIHSIEVNGGVGAINLKFKES